MDLTPTLKLQIDALSAASLRKMWDHSPLDDPLFNGESGTYWEKRMVAAEKEAAETAAMAFSCRPLLASRPPPQSAPEAILAALVGPSVVSVAPAADELDVVDELLLVHGMLIRSLKELKATQALVQRAMDEILELKRALELSRDDGR